MTTHLASQFARRLGLDRLPLIGSTVRTTGRLINNIRYRERGVEARIDEKVSLRLSPFAFSGGSFHFEPTLTRALQQLAGTGKDFMDVGAHLGIASLLYAHFSNGRSRVAAFEPNPATFPLLVENVRLNQHRVETYRLALADKVQTADFFFYGTAQNASLSSGPPEIGLTAQGMEATALQNTKVTVSTIDAFACAIGLAPGVIKIDVEGAELQVLKGAAETLRTLRPSIFMETHMFAWQSFGYSGADLERFLGDHGYATYDLSGERFTGRLGTGTQEDNNYYVLRPE